MVRVATVATATLLSLAVTGCVGATRETDGIRAGSTVGTPTQTTTPSQSAVSPDRPRTQEATPASMASNGSPRHSWLSIPAIGVRGLRVVAYRGSPDDGPGTRVQNRGVAASPYGAGGGVGPGGVGNYIVTAHRTSSTRAFANLPSLRIGQRVHVDVDRIRYTYRITETRTTSFRSAKSLARQAAAVPGQPGSLPTHAMITLSTCATQEDHARGNYWADEFGNPEHRIDKVGILVGSRPV